MDAVEAAIVLQEPYKVIKEFLIEWPNRLLVIRLNSSGKIWFLVFNETTRKLLRASQDIEEALFGPKPA
jgi:hypothetical protein